MRYIIHYCLTAAWGLATPLMMLYGVQELLYSVGSQGEIRGHATPVEYLLPWLLIGFCALMLFLACNFFSVKCFLSNQKRKKLHFFLSLGLYLIAAVFGLPVLLWLESLL